MWIPIVLIVLLIFGPTRRLITANGSWRFCLPAVAGAVIGWYLGKFVFASYAFFWWAPFAWAAILGVLVGNGCKSWFDKTFGGGR